ncbi:MAG: hypothetical protein K6E62_08155 [Lachnospiraceae bacterium]|nr:hypothetical protein [Lachnospiraceae bacterium]
MAVYLNEKEEEQRLKELEEYSRETQAKIEEDRINGKARRKKQDKIFQKIVLIVFAAVLIMLIISWAR